MTQPGKSDPGFLAANWSATLTSRSFPSVQKLTGGAYEDGASYFSSYRAEPRARDDDGRAGHGQPGPAGHPRGLARQHRITSILRSGRHRDRRPRHGPRHRGADRVADHRRTARGRLPVPRLLARAPGAAVSVLHPAFREVTSATFYGPNTHLFNPRAIPAGQVRAVGSYVSSAGPRGVHDQGMIYLGPLSGRGGSWTSIDVPAYGAHVTGHVRACPRSQRRCRVMDTIAHSTMGNLVVGNYDLNPTVRGGVVSGNAFIYNITRRRWTLLRMHGSLSTKSTLYGIWQDGGPGSPRYTLAGGSAAGGAQRGFLINYNERTGAFGRPASSATATARHKDTHFDGITAVPGGFNLVAISTGQAPSLANVPVRHGRFGRARWFPVNVGASALCPCSVSPGTRCGATGSWGCTSRRVPRPRTPISPPSRRGRRAAWPAPGTARPGAGPGTLPRTGRGGRARARGGCGAGRRGRRGAWRRRGERPG